MNICEHTSIHIVFHDNVKCKYYEKTSNEVINNE